MKKLVLAFAIGAATLLGGTAVNAADRAAKPDSDVNARIAVDASQSTDMSSHRRHWRRHWRHHHYGWRPYHRSYGYYAPRRYYAPAPVVSFGFGPRWHHHRHVW